MRRMSNFWKTNFVKAFDTLKFIFKLLRVHTITQLIVGWCVGTLGLILNDRMDDDSVLPAVLIGAGVGVFAIIIIVWIIAALVNGVSYLAKKIFKK